MATGRTSHFCGIRIAPRAGAGEGKPVRSREDRTVGGGMERREGQVVCGIMVAAPVSLALWVALASIVRLVV